jgi:hypothetical protein
MSWKQEVAMPIGRGGGISNRGDEGESEGLTTALDTDIAQAPVTELVEVTLPVASLSDGWAIGS